MILVLIFFNGESSLVPLEPLKPNLRPYKTLPNFSRLDKYIGGPYKLCIDEVICLSVNL